LEELIAQLKS